MPTKIEWADETWNPIRGTIGKWHCTKVSEGCRNCYAERMNRRFRGPPYVKGADTLRLDEKVLEQPLHWKKPRMVFVCSMTDLFHTDVKDAWLHLILRVMLATPQHTYQILTKRPHRLADEVWRASLSILPNVWVGVTVENQQAADERIPLLLKTPAAVRFVSCEPLLGPIILDSGVRGGPPCYLSREVDHPEDAMLDWVICGGESGPGARPMQLGWAAAIVEQCKNAGVACLVKQIHLNGDPRRLSKLPEEWPEYLRVREYPNAT